MTRLYLRSNLTSPAPTDPSVLANSPSGAGNFAAFDERVLSLSHTGVAADATTTAAFGNGATRGLLWITDPGLPGFSTFPAGAWPLTLVITALTGTGGTPVAVNVNARILVVDENNVVTQAGNIAGGGSVNMGTDTLPKTLSMTIATTTFALGSASDRLCLQVYVSDAGSQTSTTAFSIEVNSGLSYLDSPVDFGVPLDLITMCGFEEQAEDGVLQVGSQPLFRTYTNSSYPHPTQPAIAQPGQDNNWERALKAVTGWDGVGTACTDETLEFSIDFGDHQSETDPLSVFPLTFRTVLIGLRYTPLEFVDEPIDDIADAIVILTFSDSTSFDNVSLRIELGSNRLYWHSNEFGDIYATSATAPIGVNHHYELGLSKDPDDNTNGKLRVLQDGALVDGLDVTVEMEADPFLPGIEEDPTGTCDGIYFGLRNNPGTPTGVFDDVYVEGRFAGSFQDHLSASHFHSSPGRLPILKSLRPTAQGAFSDFARYTNAITDGGGDATNYTYVNETPINEQQTYLQSTDLLDRDSWVMDVLPVTAVAIIHVQTLMKTCFSTDDSGEPKIGHSFVHESVVYDHPDEDDFPYTDGPKNSEWATQSRWWPLRPWDDADWELSDFTSPHELSGYDNSVGFDDVIIGGAATLVLYIAVDVAAPDDHLYTLPITGVGW